MRCREIKTSDLNDVTALLTTAFPRDRPYWIRALQTLTDHPTPPELPKYGYALDDDGKLVGAVLLIATSVQSDGATHNRCNVSSWCVDPAFRAYGSILSTQAIRRKNTTYFNVSPAAHTWTLLEQQGFTRFANGRVIAAPALNRAPPRVRVSKVDAHTPVGPDLSRAEIDMMLDHSKYGCLSFICEEHGERYPWVFGLQRRYGCLPVAHLVYCRNIDTFVYFAGSIGRFLARHGYTLVICDSDGPIPGLVGRYYGNRPRYRKGGDQIRLGDVAYSEQVMFGY